MYMISQYTDTGFNAATKCKNKDAELVSITDIDSQVYMNGILANRIRTGTSYTIDGFRPQYGSTFVSRNGGDITISSSLWASEQPDCSSKSNICCIALIKGKLEDNPCMTANRFICVRKVVPLLRLPLESGNIELTYDRQWGPLCFDPGLTSVETDIVCQNQYQYLYNSFSGTYIFSSQSWRMSCFGYSGIYVFSSQSWRMSCFGYSGIYVFSSQSWRMSCFGYSGIYVFSS
ncbi:uncharacterized protein [Argopecten irradians]|uniref:uncharacterized protein n=1 Tax=Argopecten irradians TaxID=31199 RepID=UPI00372276C0